jgi:hypothetical protein
VLGGPVDKAWGKENAQNLPFGVPGIIGNDMGFDKEPPLPEFMAAVQQFSRRLLLDQTKNAPMLVSTKPFSLLTDKEPKELPASRPAAISFCVNLEFHAKIAE